MAANSILTAASFPEDLSGVDAATTRTLRREWELWNNLQRRPSFYPVAISCSAITRSPIRCRNSIPNDVNGRKYSIHNQRQLARRKGRNVRQYGFDRTSSSAKYLQVGQSFPVPILAASACICRVALGNTGPGNATTWRGARNRTPRRL